MNRLEFNEVLKEFDIDNSLIDTTGRYNSNEESHSWDNTSIYFSDSYYAIVKGRIPFEVDKIISEKYQKEQYGIRPVGSNNSCNQVQFPDANSLAIPEESKNDASKKEAKNTYIETYHIDSKEGLIILLTELKDYYARKLGLPETEVQRYNEILSTINARILMKINPTITTYDWMGEDEQYCEKFLDTIVRDHNTPFEHEFREAIDQFDKTINPYINEDIELDSIENYSQKLDISASSYNSLDGMYRENCCTMVIKAKDGTGKVRYYRKPHGFTYHLMYTFGPQEYLDVLHYFTTIGDKETDIGEHIYISYSGENSKQKIDLRYNITKGLSGETYEDKTPITTEQKVFVYNELVKATNLASRITIDNMQKKGIQKKLVSNQKLN